MASGTGISMGNAGPYNTQIGASTSIFDQTSPSVAYNGSLPSAMGGNTAAYESNQMGFFKGGYIPIPKQYLKKIKNKNMKRRITSSRNKTKSKKYTRYTYGGKKGKSKKTQKRK